MSFSPIPPEPRSLDELASVPDVRRTPSRTSPWLVAGLVVGGVFLLVLLVCGGFACVSALLYMRAQSDVEQKIKSFEEEMKKEEMEQPKLDDELIKRRLELEGENGQPNFDEIRDHKRDKP